MEIRLHKFLAHAGIASRRKCEELIQAGTVRVDDTVITELGCKIDPDQVRVYYNNRLIKAEPKVYWLFNKPKGVICTTGEQEHRPKVVDYFGALARRQRLYTIGRLDAEAEGLLIVTNDGELCEHLTHPRYKVPKTYWVVARGQINPMAMQKIQSGIWLSEGKTSPARIRVIRQNREATIVEITLVEGKNREVRRIFAKIGNPIRAIKRIKIGDLSLGNLKAGQLQPIKRTEIIKYTTPQPTYHKPFDQKTRPNTKPVKNPRTIKPNLKKH
jgi:23S rRNA pseudouridine2605 synthase